MKISLIIKNISEVAAPDKELPLLHVLGNCTSWIGASKDSRPIDILEVDNFLYGLMKFESRYHSYRDMGHYLTSWGCYGVPVDTDKPGIYGLETMKFEVKIED